MTEINSSGPVASSGLSDTAAGAIAYITFIPALIFLLVEPYNKNTFVRFHAWQSIALAVTATVINIALGIVFSFAWVFMLYLHFALMRLVDLLWLVVWIICVVNAANGKKFKLPFIGDFAEQQANK